MAYTRRSFLKLGLMGGAGLALPLGVLQTGRTRIHAAEAIRSPALPRFEVPLPVPPVLRPVRSDATTDYYEMVQKVGTTEIVPGTRTEVWGFDGVYPGPTIAARTGRTAVVRQRNELPVPVATHLHGGVTPPESDGYPTDLILPAGGEDGAHAGHHAAAAAASGHKDYAYPNEQRGGTLWYHDHRMDFTGPQVYRGLAGFYIVRDETDDRLPLPAGDKDVPLMIADRIFQEDGSFYYPSIDPSLTGAPGVLGKHMNGVYGDTILVNGAPWPFMEVTSTRYRFRILNASNARIYELALDPPPPGGKPFVQVGSDAGLLQAPLGHERIRIASAERFDTVIDFSRYPVGTEVTLKNLRGDGPTADVMRFVVARAGTEDSTVPARLAPDETVPDPKDAATTRTFEFLSTPEFLGVSFHPMWTVNLKHFDPDRVDYRPRLGTTEVWEFFSDADHPVHVHLAHFRVLSRNGRKPPPQDSGWKDTVLVRFGETVRVLADFSGYRGRYVFHCHNLEHEDMMMMDNFEVV